MSFRTIERNLFEQCKLAGHFEKFSLRATRPPLTAVLIEMTINV
jgi:hypothetical protein